MTILRSQQYGLDHLKSLKDKSQRVSPVKLRRRKEAVLFHVLVGVLLPQPGSEKRENGLIVSLCPYQLPH